MDEQNGEVGEYGRSWLANIIATSDLTSTPFFNCGLALRGVLEIEAASTGNKSAPQWSCPVRAFERALELQDKIPLSSSLYRGITGIGWGIQLLPEHQQLDAAPSMLGELDELLADGIECTSNPNLDLINGLAGIMVYAMRRGLDAPSSRNLWLAIESACASALSAWLLIEKKLQPQRGKTDSLRNLGVAHGIPGLLMLGAIASKRSYLSPGLVQPLKDGFDHLWKFSLNQGGAAIFPSQVGETKPARLAWCYGGIGIAEAFKVAATLDARNAERFRRTLRGALYQFEQGDHGIQDASLCHGYSGAAFFFTEFAKSKLVTDEERISCLTSAQSAYTKTIAMNTGTVEQPRFTWRSGQKYIESSSYLEGAAGVVLATRHIEEASDRDAPWAEALGFYSS